MYIYYMYIYIHIYIYMIYWYDRFHIYYIPPFEINAFVFRSKHSFSLNHNK